MMICESLGNNLRKSDASIRAFSRLMGCSRESRAGVSRRIRWQSGLLFLLCCLALVLNGCVSGTLSDASRATSASLHVSPGAVAFGAVRLGQTTSSNVSVLNQSSVAVRITNLSVTGQSFSVSGTNDLPITLAAGGTYNLSVNFSPTSAGAATGELTIATNATNAATIAVSLSGTAASSSTPAVSVLSCANGIMTGAGTDDCKVTLNAAAPSGGETVNLVSNAAAVSVPATATVAAGASSVSFTAAVAAVTSAETVTLSAGAGGVAETFALQLEAVAPGLSLSSKNLAFGSVAVGTARTQPVTLSSTGTEAVTLNAASVSGAGFTISGLDLPMTLAPGQTATLEVKFDPSAPGSATGQLTIASDCFGAETAVVGLSGTGTIAASAAVAPTLSVSAKILAFGSVALNSTATESVTLTSTGSTYVTVSAATVSGLGFGASGANFPLNLSPAQTATLTVQFDPTAAGAATGELTLTSNSSTGTSTVVDLSGTGVPVLSGLSCSSGLMTTSGTDSCTVTLNAAAASGGFSVSLASNNSAVAVPATVTVAPGATTASFLATVSSVSTAQKVTLTANAGGASESFALQLGTAAPSLTVSTNSLNFGTVALNTQAVQSLTLLSSGASPVTVSLATVQGAGFSLSGSVLPLILSSGQTATIQVAFDPTTAGAATGTLTIVSTSLTNATTTVNLNGTGNGTAYQVNLTWDTPSNSPVPIAGYDIYRSSDGGNTYQQINQSLVTLTTYLDGAVQAEQTYIYMAESVDTSGVQSAPSNLASVTIP